MNPLQLMQLQIFQHGVEKMSAAQIRTDSPIEEAFAEDEHLEEAADAVHEDAWHRSPFSPFIGIFGPNRRI